MTKIQPQRPNQIVPSRVRLARLSASLSLGRLGDLVGLSLSTISSIERGRSFKAKTIYLRSMAAATGVNPDFFERPMTTSDEARLAVLTPSGLPKGRPTKSKARALNR